MKSDLELYDYWPYEGRPKIEWPNGAKVAFWVAPNIEFYEIDPPANPLRQPWPRPHPDVLPTSIRDYGNRSGHWRMMEVMDKYNVRGSISLSTGLIDHHPELIEVTKDRNWEFFSHGIYNTRYSYALDEAQERAILEDSLESVEKATGQRLAGYLAPALTHTENTMDLLAEYGFKYTCDLFQDDQPQPINVKSGRLISMPYSLEINDFIIYYAYGATPRRYGQMMCDQFDQLLAEGADSGTVMCIPLHAYLVGHPHRIGGLERALEYITGHSPEDVWVTTAREIAEYYYEHYYDVCLADIQARSGGAGQ
jgi:peptidoglycan/xylan/chitin deacetylase (PgdA/CDA1 family)